MVVVVCSDLVVDCIVGRDFLIANYAVYSCLSRPPCFILPATHDHNPPRACVGAITKSQLRQHQFRVKQAKVRPTPVREVFGKIELHYASHPPHVPPGDNLHIILDGLLYRKGSDVNRLVVPHEYFHELVVSVHSVFFHSHAHTIGFFRDVVYIHHWLPLVQQFLNDCSICKMCAPRNYHAHRTRDPYSCSTPSFTFDLFYVPCYNPKRRPQREPFVDKSTIILVCDINSDFVFGDVITLRI